MPWVKRAAQRPEEPPPWMISSTMTIVWRMVPPLPPASSGNPTPRNPAAPPGPPHGTAPAASLVLASATVLFQELALIRWLPSQVRVLAYSPNLVLLSAFLGLGLGCLRAGRRSRLWSWPAALLLTVATMLLLGRVAFTQDSKAEHLPGAVGASGGHTGLLRGVALRHALPGPCRRSQRVRLEPARRHGGRPTRDDLHGVRAEGAGAGGAAGLPARLGLARAGADSDAVRSAGRAMETGGV